MDILANEVFNFLNYFLDKNLKFLETITFERPKLKIEAHLKQL